MCCLNLPHLRAELRDAVTRVRRKPRMLQGCVSEAKLSVVRQRSEVPTPMTGSQRFRHEGCSAPSTMPYNLTDPITARRAAMACVLMWLVAVAPLVFATYPLLHDYPSHLARIHILVHWHASPALQRWYDLHAFLLPNMGMDLLAWALAQLVPVDVAGRLVIAASLGTILSGCLVLHRHLHGAYACWPLVAAVFLYNRVFLFGFLNYLLGVGLLLWATGLWIAWRSAAPWRRFLWGTGWAVVLFFCHLAALGVYAVILVGYEVQRSATTARISWQLAGRDLLVSAATFILPVWLFLWSSTAVAVGGTGEAFRDTAHLRVWKPLTAYQAVMAGQPFLDTVLLAALAVGSVTVVIDGRLRVAKAMYGPLALLLVTYLVMPFHALGVAYADSRLPVAILMVVIGSTHLSLRRRTANRALLAGLVAVLVVRMLVLATEWQRDERVTRVLVTAFAALPPGGILFAASEAPPPTYAYGFMDLLFLRPPLNHVTGLATLQQPIFVPVIFANRSQQPITVRSRYAALYAFQEQNPLPVASAADLAAITNQIRRLLAEAGEVAPVFLLVLYPNSGSCQCQTGLAS